MGINSARDAPHPHPVPHRERALGHMRHNHPSHHMRELQPPRAEEGDERRRIQNIAIIPPRVRQPCHLNARAEDEGEQEQEGRGTRGGVVGVRGSDSGFGPLGRGAHVHVGRGDVEEEAQGAEDHKAFVEWQVGELGDERKMIDVEEGEEALVPELRTCNKVDNE
jgi:hypothetical protein